MIKYGCMALVAMACSAAVPAAQAKGNFFVAGQAGRAEYNDSHFDDNSADTRAISGGYRWQAGPIAQVGIEGGVGTVDEISDDYFFYDGYTQINRRGMKTDYRHLGANARINFGQDSRWFALVRGGYAAYGLDASSHFEARSSDGLLVYRQDSSGNDNGDGAYFGGGVGVDLTSHVNLNVMFNGYAYSFGESYYSSDEAGTATTTTLGVEVRF